MFKDRQDAGQRLAKKLHHYRQCPDGVVIGLPRGGVVTAYEVAKELRLPLDVTCPRKIGAPFNPEFAIGAITETGEGLLNEPVIARLGISEAYLEHAIEVEKQRAQQRVQLYHKQRPKLSLEEKTVILVDDGLATGATMKAAIQSVRQEGAKYIVAAVPVSPQDTLEEIQALADEAIALETPFDFGAVGQFYQMFDQVEDAEVIHLLELAKSS